MTRGQSLASAVFAPQTSGDALVIGGGLAGASLAVRLAKAGRAVMLLEKTSAAHPKVCGEFLSYEALHYVSQLSVDVEALGAVTIRGVRLVKRGIVASAALPFPARSLSRERLDEALLERASAVGVQVLRHRHVRSLIATDGRWLAETDTSERFAAEHAFLATGKHDLHGWNRPPGRQNDLIAFKMYYRLSSEQQAALGEHVELILFPGGYAGLQRMEDRRANLCLLVTRTAYREAGGSWSALLTHLERHAEHLAVRLDGATAIWDRPLSLSAIPYGLVRRSSPDGLWRLGDQSAVIASFAGDGMSIALHSAALAARMFLAGAEAGAYQKRLARQLSSQVGLATALSRSLVHVPAVLRAAARLWPGVLQRVAASTRLRRRDLVL